MERPPTELPGPRRSRARVLRNRNRAVVILAVIVTLLVGCSGGSAPEDSSADSTPPPEIVEAPIYYDPAIPITSPVGKEFDVMLPADPGSGWRWVLAPIDNTKVIALGSRFSDDPTLLTRADSVTTTTSTTSTIAPTRAPATTAEDATTTTSAAPVLPLVQIISFAGRAGGPTTLTFRYTQIAGTPQEENRLATFSIQIVP